jgi:thiosulfate dehydrogenase
MTRVRSVSMGTPYFKPGLLALIVAITACGSDDEPQIVTEHVTPAERGRQLYSDPKASPSPYNRFSCATCHASPDVVADPPDQMFTGAPMAGVMQRSSYWGGQEFDLLSAINECRTLFMEATAPWSADEDPAKSLYAYLSSLPPGGAAPVPFTLTKAPYDVPAGDKAAGAEIHRRACKPCHGQIHDGEGRLTTRAALLPDEPLRDHANYSPAGQRLVFIEKVRHGGFFGYGGNMAPFSNEVLSDADLGALLAYMDLYR